MSNDNTRLFRLEIRNANGQTDCYQCIHAQQFGEVLTPIALKGETATGTMIEIFDYQSWRPDQPNKPLIRLQAL